MLPAFRIFCLAAVSSVVAAHAQAPKPAIELKTAADYLALRVSGRAPAQTTALEHRFAESGSVADSAPWIPVKTTLGVDGAFAFAVPLASSRWSELHLRAMNGSEVLAKRETKFRPDTLRLLTPERLSALPDAERTAWVAYVARSEKRRSHEFDVLAAECRKLGLANSNPAPGSRAELEIDSDTPASFFASAETRALAKAVISYQTPSGGWSKAVDYNQGPRSPGTHWTAQTGEAWHYCGTIDNRTTTEQIKLLAGVYSATKDEAAKAAALRGLEYLFEAKYPNGGWPQNYPIESGYHEAITLNDNAMIHVLEVLLLVANKEAMFAFVDDALAERAQTAMEKGIACFGAMQVKVKGKLTVWCAQHDPLSLAPVQARAKEPPSLSGAESAEVTRFLMRKAPITEASKRMIDSALAWFDAHRVVGLRKTTNAQGKTDYVADSSSKEVYWARFYDVQTGKPMFAGAQDGIIYATFSEMAAKNKVAYDFFTTKPADLLTKEVERWKKRLAKER